MKLGSLVFGLVLGAAAGVGGMMLYGYRVSPSDGNNSAKQQDGNGDSKKPSAKARLASLVTKLDILVGNVPKIELSMESRGELARQLHQLGGLEKLTESDAERRIEKILAAVGKDVDKLSLVGFQVGDKNATAQFSKAANPFIDGVPQQRLSSLQKYAGPPPMKIELLPPPVLVKSPKS